MALRKRTRCIAGVYLGAHHQGRHMPTPYDTTSEAALHEDAIEALIAETHLPPHAVRSAYEREYQRLRTEAQVKDFLVLFTVRRAREALRRLRG